MQKSLFRISRFHSDPTVTKDMICLAPHLLLSGMSSLWRGRRMQCQLSRSRVLDDKVSQLKNLYNRNWIKIYKHLKIKWIQTKVQLEPYHQFFLLSSAQQCQRFQRRVWISVSLSVPQQGSPIQIREANCCSLHTFPINVLFLLHLSFPSSVLIFLLLLGS